MPHGRCKAPEKQPRDKVDDVMLPGRERGQNRSRQKCKGDATPKRLRREKDEDECGGYMEGRKCVWHSRQMDRNRGSFPRLKPMRTKCVGGPAGRQQSI